MWNKQKNEKFKISKPGGLCLLQQVKKKLRTKLQYLTVIWVENLSGARCLISFQNFGNTAQTAINHLTNFLLTNSKLLLSVQISCGLSNVTFYGALDIFYKRIKKSK